MSFMDCGALYIWMVAWWWCECPLCASGKYVCDERNGWIILNFVDRKHNVFGLNWKMYVLGMNSCFDIFYRLVCVWSIERTLFIRRNIICEMHERAPFANTFSECTGYDRMKDGSGKRYDICFKSKRLRNLKSKNSYPYVCKIFFYFFFFSFNSNINLLINNFFHNS